MGKRFEFGDVVSVDVDPFGNPWHNTGIVVGFVSGEDNGRAVEIDFYGFGNSGVYDESDLREPTLEEVKTALYLAILGQPEFWGDGGDDE